MDVKQYLGRTKFSEVRILSKKARLDTLKRLIRIADIDLLREKLRAQQDELNRDIEELADARREIDRLIRRVSKPEYRTVLELRYIRGWTWDRIAAEMQYCNSHVRYLNDKALRECESLLQSPACSGEKTMEESDEIITAAAE